MEDKYTEIVYRAKKIEWERVNYPEELKNLPIPK